VVDVDVVTVVVVVVVVVVLVVVVDVVAILVFGVVFEMMNVEDDEVELFSIHLKGSKMSVSISFSADSVVS